MWFVQSWGRNSPRAVNNSELDPQRKAPAWDVSRRGFALLIHASLLFRTRGRAALM